MQTNFTVQSKKLKAFDIGIIAWGCITLPMWLIAVYNSFEDYYAYYVSIPSLLLSTLAVGITLCWIFSPYFKRRAAITALALGCTLTFVTLMNNSYNGISTSFTLLSFAFDILFFIVPSSLLWYVHTFQQEMQPTTQAAITPKSSREIAITVLFGLFILVVVILLYGLGFSSH